MTYEQPLMTPEAAGRLMERLSRLRSVTRFDQPERPQSATIAHSFTDLEKSFREFLEVLLPKLLDESLTADELNDLLQDTGEEFRHILYHIKDPKFFEYLLD